MVRIYEFKRSKRIEEITELLKSMMKDGEIENKKELLTTICIRYGVSRRTAAEYLATAKMKNEQS